MADNGNTALLKRGAKVVSLTDGRGVPRGTTGRVAMVCGLTWIRYFVDYDNGVSRPSVDRATLATPSEWRESKNRPAGIVQSAVAQVADSGAGDSQVTAAAVGGIPAHLLERSRMARARLAAKTD